MENKIAEKIIRTAVSDIASADPEAGTRLGQGAHDDKWDAPDGANLTQDAEILEHYARLLEDSVDTSKLSERNRVRTKLLAWNAEQMKRAAGLLADSDLVNPVDGPQVRLPIALLTSQPDKTLGDFKNYISRLRAFAPYVDSVIALDAARRKASPLPVFAGADQIVAECTALTTGRPFSDTGDASPLLDDFSNRLAKSGLDKGLGDTLMHEARHALTDAVGPACRRLSTYAKQLGTTATGDIAPPDKALYTKLLASHTSTDLSPAQVHDLALQRISQVTSEITDIMNREGFEGSPAQFMDHLRSDTTSLIGSNDNTVQQWLNNVGGFVFNLDAAFGDMLSKDPDTDLEVRAMQSLQVPTGRAGAYYPTHGLGIFYINLPVLHTWQVEAITYRYTIPGQHAIPYSPLNRIVGIPVFTDGWSLYGLALPMAHGYYKQPRANLGRLLVVLQAAAEALIDIQLNTGVWTRPQALDYLKQHSIVTETEGTRIIDGILAKPAAATAAIVGEATILRLRDKVQLALGSGFSQKNFNDLVLHYGPLPMPLLDFVVNQWLNRATNGKMKTSESQKAQSREP
ncbi:MAG TPA: DUF885 domain-containing protein [Pseudomonadales bacterium]|nr:DUF885 domain-containing protein [Pseudomonadales bacterium]